MGKYDGATIEVINWDKYNPRTDSKRPTWFRFENALATGPAFFGLDSDQKWLWVVILSLVSQANGKPITWNSDYVHSLTGIKVKKQDETLGIFEKFVRLRVSREVTTGDSPATDERTDGRDETDETNELLPTGSSPDRPAGTIVWEAYSYAYRKRYGVEPVRNAAVNSQLKQFASRLPGNEAPEVAIFYLTHSDWYYVKNRHPVGAMLRDAEKLRTEWATGVKSTTAAARSADQMQGIESQMQRVLDGTL